MPYRRAHYWLIALFPVIILAFWPTYFGHITTARVAQHSHAVCATAWLALLIMQSWAAHRRNVAWHRAAGLAVFVVVPLFAAAGVYAMRDMAIMMTRGAPFESAATPALLPDDISSILAIVGFVAMALAVRRRIAAHASWMLATALLVLAPITVRLIQVVLYLVGAPRLNLGIGFLMAQSITIALALLLARRRSTDAAPYIAVIALVLAQLAAYPILGNSPGWRSLLVAFGQSAPLPEVLGAGTLSLAILIAAWRSVPPKGRASRPSPAGEPRQAIA